MIQHKSEGQADFELAIYILFVQLIVEKICDGGKQGSHILL